MTEILTREVYADKVTGAGKVHEIWKLVVTEKGSMGQKLYRRQLTRKKSFGYCVFYCPYCDKRNKRALEAGKILDAEKGTIGFTCHNCHFTVPVKPPLEISLK